jgi:hypothetical protein
MREGERGAKKGGKRTVPLGEIAGIDELSELKRAVTSVVAVLRRRKEEREVSTGEGDTKGGRGLNAREVRDFPDRRENTSCL